MQLTPSTTARAQQAKQKIADARQVFEGIRQDKSLSDEGRRQSLALEWWHRKQEIQALEEAELAGRRERRDALHRKLFGTDGYLTGSDIISQRDAVDRASRLESPEEAERLITAARRNGDTSLMKAIAEQSFARGWISALEHWANGDTQVEEEISELYTLAATRSGTAEVASLMQHAFAFNLEKPREIAELPATSLDALVGESTASDRWATNTVQQSQFGRSDRAADYNTAALNGPEITARVQNALGNTA